MSCDSTRLCQVSSLNFGGSFRALCNSVFSLKYLNFFLSVASCCDSLAELSIITPRYLYDLTTGISLQTLGRMSGVLLSFFTYMIADFCLLMLK
jgi:hypothetical protein